MDFLITGKTTNLFINFLIIFYKSITVVSEVPCFSPLSVPEASLTSMPLCSSEWLEGNLKEWEVLSSKVFFTFLKLTSSFDMYQNLIFYKI